MTELDYGTLLCSATNKIGKQKLPCIFHIIVAGELSKCGPSSGSIITLTLDFGEESLPDIINDS